MGAVLQLERFDRFEPPLPEIRHFTQADIDVAREEGHAAGMAAAERGAAEELTAALTDLGARLDRAAQDAAEDSTRAVRALGPVLAALIDGIMPQLARARLESALLAELMQLSAAVTPLSAVIRCGADLGPFVAACAARAGIDAVEIDASAPEGTVEIELLGGSMAWDSAAIARQLGDLVREIMETE